MMDLVFILYLPATLFKSTIYGTADTTNINSAKSTTPTKLMIYGAWWSTPNYLDNSYTCQSQTA